MVTRHLILLIVTIICVNLTLQNLKASREEAKIIHNIMESMLSSPAKEVFKTYHFLYRKSYNLNSVEGIKRYKAFKANLKLVKEINAKNLPYKYGINQFSDMTTQEYKEWMRAGQEHQADHFLQEVKKERSVINFDEYVEAEEKTNLKENETTISYDWREYTGSVRNQYDNWNSTCQTCWSMSATTVLDGVYAINYKAETGQLPTRQISTQQLMDCSLMRKDVCMMNKHAIDDMVEFYVTSNTPAYFNDEWEWKSGNRSNSCVAPNTNDSVNFGSKFFCNKKYDNKCDESLVIENLKSGPGYTIIDSGSEKYKNYASGVLEFDEQIETERDCYEFCHKVALVGYYYSQEESQEYWIIQNVYGTTWGEAGYARIKRQDKIYSCGLTHAVWFPTLA